MDDTSLITQQAIQALCSGCVKALRVLIAIVWSKPHRVWANMQMIDLGEYQTF